MIQYHDIIINLYNLQGHGHVVHSNYFEHRQLNTKICGDYGRLSVVSLFVCTKVWWVKIYCLSCIWYPWHYVLERPVTRISICLFDKHILALPSDPIYHQFRFQDDAMVCRHIILFLLLAICAEYLSVADGFPARKTSNEERNLAVSLDTNATILEKIANDQ